MTSPLPVAGSDTRRIDDPADWIRRELAEAFAAGVRVIPVLTDDAEMPTEDELPGDLAALARCQYRRLRHRDAGAQQVGLAEAIRRRPQPPAEPSGDPRHHEAREAYAEDVADEPHLRAGRISDLGIDVAVLKDGR